MDKKNTTIGILLLITAFGALYWGQLHSQQPATPAQVRQAVAQAGQSPDSAAPAQAAAPAPAAPGEQAAFEPHAAQHTGATVTTLVNAFTQVGAFALPSGSADAALLQKLGRPLVAAGGRHGARAYTPSAPLGEGGERRRAQSTPACRT